MVGESMHEMQEDSLGCGSESVAGGKSGNTWNCRPRFVAWDPFPTWLKRFAGFAISRLVHPPRCIPCIISNCFDDQVILVHRCVFLDAVPLGWPF